MVPVNYLAILASAILSMVIGAFWYGSLFSKAWMKEMGWNQKDREKMAKEKGPEMNKMYLFQFVGSLFMAFVLSHAIVFAKSYLHTEGVSAGLQTGFWNWLGFVAPVTLTSVLWEGKSWKLWMINNGNYLLTLLVMGITMAVWV